MKDRPLVIAGPCAAESYQLMTEVCAAIMPLAEELGFDFVFKASFDKANRSSAGGLRGPGVDRALQWFSDIKEKFGVRVLTDVHETHQVQPVAEVCDILQIPAFLCRQTDLVHAAAISGAAVNIKKGQFLAPHNMKNIVDKAREAKPDVKIYITERGASFGYGNLVVDMRSFPIMAESKAPVILDITHSTQLPASGGSATSSGERCFAPVLARAATATGYLDGYFLEIHSEPAKAISDKDAQLSIAQGQTLLRQLVPLWKQMRNANSIDSQFR